MRLLYDERYVATNMRLGCLHLADVTQEGPGSWDLVAPCLRTLSWRAPRIHVAFNGRAQCLFMVDPSLR